LLINVNSQGSVYIFIGIRQNKKLKIYRRRKINTSAFRWLENEEPDTQWFDFRINVDELTGESALIVTDFSTDEEKDSTIELWDSEIAKLKHAIGL
jgi:hypothetical protein